MVTSDVLEKNLLTHSKSKHSALSAVSSALISNKEHHAAISKQVALLVILLGSAHFLHDIKVDLLPTSCV